MKKQFITLIFGLIAMVCQAQTDTIRHEVLLETDSGNIRVQLYNETPKHRDNFLKLTREGKYDGVLFHRVIKRFMVQSGDMGSKTAKSGQQLGDTPETYSIPAEIVYPKFLHKRGALAAAREPDDVNPEHASSASQFYIVWGIRYSDKQLDWAQGRLDEYTKGTVKMSPEVRELYKTVGGTPHLDATYTVFGEVVEGLGIVEKIQSAACDENDRPNVDIRIIRATVVK